MDHSHGAGMPQARVEHLPSQPSPFSAPFRFHWVGPFQTAKNHWPSSLFKKIKLMKANRCEVKTWREQFLPGQKGSKHCPCGQPVCEYPPFRGVSVPKDAAPH